VTALRIVVPGKAVSVNRNRMGDRRGLRPFAKTPEAREFHQRVAAYGALARSRARWPTYLGPVDVAIWVYYDSERPDIDGPEKAILDALQVPNARLNRPGASVYKNDRQVRAKLTVRDVDRANPRVEVVVAPRGELITLGTVLRLAQPDGGAR
jgi:Holliday junction resolvase RusA-like endonuclease